VLAPSNTAAPCRRKVNRPPSDAAVAIAADLLGERGADPVIDLDVTAASTLPRHRTPAR